MFANYHTHTTRCNHAAGTDREYVEYAIRSGIKILGFADHTPLPDSALVGMDPRICQAMSHPSLRCGKNSKTKLNSILVWNWNTTPSVSIPK